MLKQPAGYEPKFKPGNLVKSAAFGLHKIIVGMVYMDLKSPGFENTLCYVYFENGQKSWIACHILDETTDYVLVC